MPEGYVNVDGWFRYQGRGLYTPSPEPQINDISQKIQSDDIILLEKS